MIVTDGKSRRCALLWWLEEIVYAIAVDLKILQCDLHLCSPGSVLLNLLAPSVDSAQQSRDYTTVGQRLSSSHCMCLAGTGAAMRKDG